MRKIILIIIVSFSVGCSKTVLPKVQETAALTYWIEVRNDITDAPEEIFLSYHRCSLPMDTVARFRPYKNNRVRVNPVCDNNITWLEIEPSCPLNKCKYK